MTKRSPLSFELRAALCEILIGWALKVSPAGYCNSIVAACLMSRDGEARAITRRAAVRLRQQSGGGSRARL